jgi:hypothetical protein
MLLQVELEQPVHFGIIFNNENFNRHFSPDRAHAESVSGHFALLILAPFASGRDWAQAGTSAPILPAAYSWETAFTYGILWYEGIRYWKVSGGLCAVSVGREPA